MSWLKKLTRGRSGGLAEAPPLDGSPLSDLVAEIENSPEMRNALDAFAGQLGEDPVRQVKALLLSENMSPERQALAALTLARVGPPAIPGLVELLGHKDYSLALFAAKTLATIEGALPHLRTALASPDGKTRLHAAGALQSLGRKAAPAASDLCALIRREAGPSAGASDIPEAAGVAAGALGRIGSGALSEIGALLTDASVGVRLCAVSALLRIGAPALGLLVEARSREKDQLVFVALQDTIARIGHEAGPPAAQETGAAPEAETAPPDTWRSPSTGMEFVWIRPGEFEMGSDGPEASVREKPAHRARVTRGFHLGKYPVTQAQFQAVIGWNPSLFKYSGAEDADRPVEKVSLKDAQEFLRKLNRRGEGLYRLPTEAEWEYAARAGCREERYGSPDEISWHSGNSGRKTHPVGRKQPNAWGLHDMLGNVLEWCEGFYAAYPGGVDYNPHLTTRVLRGGSWHYDAGDARASCRFRGDPGVTDENIGFRCVREVNESPSKRRNPLADFFFSRKVR